MRIRGIVALAVIAAVSSTSAVSAVTSSIRSAASVDNAAQRAPAPVLFTPPAPPAPPTPSSDPVQDEVVRLVNAERAARGLPGFTIDARITRAAQAHSDDMARNQRLDHVGSDGSSVGDRLTRAGYDSAGWGETIGVGYATPAAIVDGWMNSPPHRAILLGQLRFVGVAVASVGDGPKYWTLDVANPA